MSGLVDDAAAGARADRHELFALLGDPSTVRSFFDRVVDDVSWTVEGTHPLAGAFSNKQDFFDATFARLGPLMRDEVRMRLLHLFVDGDTVIAELEAGSTTLDGARYDNRLCWVCRFTDAGEGASMVEVRAYLDSAMVAWTIARNERVSRASG